jgi:putative transposase
MITRELKLKLNSSQEEKLNTWLWHLTGVYNFAIRKIKLDANDKRYYSKMTFQNLLSGHSSRLEIPSHVIQGTLVQAWSAWNRCFKKLNKKPHLKSIRNKMNSIPFPDPIKNPIEGKISLLGLGILRFHKYTLPKSKIKCGRVIKRSSGWYLQLTYDIDNKFQVYKTDKKVGIDTGFKSLLTLSDGTKIENNRSFVKLQTRMAQVQRGRNKKKVARLHEHIANQRKDYNHKVSRKIVENYKEIYITEDNLRGQAHKFGKSIMDAGIGQLRTFIKYKGDAHGRLVKFVSSINTTKTCSKCGSLTGPTGWNGLKVRGWECSACGAVHDRDVNSAMVILNLGAGTALEQRCSL